jgi:hypothetical protein
VEYTLQCGLRNSVVGLCFVKPGRKPCFRAQCGCPTGPQQVVSSILCKRAFLKAVISASQCREAIFPKEGFLRQCCQHRPVQYLNNILEQRSPRDQLRVNAKQGFREFGSTRRTIRGYEAMHMIRKGQARRVSQTDGRFDTVMAHLR